MTVEEEFAVDFNSLVAAGDLGVKMSRPNWWMIMSALQLALRHPRFPETIHGATESFARRLAAELPTTELLRTVAEAGFDVGMDVTTDEGADRAVSALREKRAVDIPWFTDLEKAPLDRWLLGSLVDHDPPADKPAEFWSPVMKKVPELTTDDTAEAIAVADAAAFESGGAVIVLEPVWVWRFDEIPLPEGIELVGWSYPPRVLKVSS